MRTVHNQPLWEIRGDPVRQAREDFRRRSEDLPSRALAGLPGFRSREELPLLLHALQRPPGGTNVPVFA